MYSVGGQASCSPCVEVDGAHSDAEYSCTHAGDSQLTVTDESGTHCAAGYHHVDNSDDADLCEPNVCMCENGDNEDALQSYVI